MISFIQNFGRGKCIVLTQEMIDYLGLDSAVEVTFEDGRIIITKATTEALNRHGKVDIHDAFRNAIEQYGPAFKAMAESRDSIEPEDQQ